jgi:DNA repair protein RecN (Recombination protein N)
MLLELRAENYTVIDRAEVQFGPGLNLLTGETGAGKSILVDALVLLLGGKASSDVIRHGQERATLACVFEATPGAQAVLEANGIDAEESTILLRREITLAGKGRVFVNNQPATVAVLRQLGPELASIHAQSETTSSFDGTQQRLLLDRFGGFDLQVVRSAFLAWQGTSRRLEELETASADRLRMADLWRFQSAEIADAGISAGDEDLVLEAEKRILSNAERLYTAAMTAHELLYEAEQSAETTVGSALKQVEELARFDPRFAEAAQQLAAAKASIEDVDASVRDFAEEVQGSPDRLASLEDRLAALERLKRKYGPSLPEVIAFGEEARSKLNEVENRDDLLAELRGTLKAEGEIYRAAAKAMSERRRAAAERLRGLAERAIGELAMRARLAVEVRSQEDERSWTGHGFDAIAFLIATNAGEPLKPLDEVASGGEMSRVMLALKVTVEDEVRGRHRKGGLERSLIFDEIDVGIGGRAAEAVGQKLKALAKGQQVLCITHLPQIAAFADRHHLIAKTEAKGRTQTSVRSLTDEERREEIARMLSGATLTETSLRHAEHLLAASR